MADHWVKEAETRANESEEYSNWIDKNTDTIIDCYIDSIRNIEDIPEDFIEQRYQIYLENRGN